MDTCNVVFWSVVVPTALYRCELWVGLPRYTCILAAPRIAAIPIVFEYTHLYIRILTNIH